MMRKAFYTILRLYVRFGMHFFYRKFSHTKMDESVVEGPVIYAANHQNAFMDALTIVMTQPRISYFLTQAGVFQKKIGNAFFSFIYMLPIYRERDGMHTVKRNKEIFEKCVDILVDGKHPLTIFPEGNHNLRRSLRPLQKGIARIAFAAIDKDPDCNPRIVPVGLNYSAHIRFRSDLYVVYGEPIEVKPFYKTYQENNNKGYVELLQAIENNLRPLIIDTPRGLQYHQISKKWVKNAWGTMNQKNNFDHNQELLQTIIEEKEVPERKTTDTPLFLKILGAPLWLFMFINNFVGFWVVPNLTKKLAKDPAFVASMNLLFGMFLLPLIFILQAIVLGLFTNFTVALVYFLAIPLLNYLYLQIYKNKFIII